MVLPIMIPPTIGGYVSTIKESSLASIVGFIELLGRGMTAFANVARTFTVDRIAWPLLGEEDANDWRDDTLANHRRVVAIGALLTAASPLSVRSASGPQRALRPSSG